jgi:transposase
MLYKNYTREMIGLESVLVESVKENNSAYVITIRMERKSHTCPICATETTMVHDYRRQNVKDLSMHGKNVTLELLKRRYTCPKCGKHFIEDIPFLPRYHRETSRLIAHVINEFRKVKPIKEIAQSVNISPTTAARIFDNVSYGRKRLPKVLSFDEFRGNAGGERFQFIVTDPLKHEVLDILPDRKQETLFKYFLEIENRKEVTHVVIDMNRSYLEVIRSIFPNARIVIDKYHVVRQVVWAFENVRKQEQKKFYDSRRKYFKHSRKLLLKHFDYLTDDELDQVESMIKISERLREAYYILNEFYGVMDSANSDEGRKRLGRWLVMQEYKLPEFKSCFKTMHNWDKYIINAFDCPYTNGYTEGVNNKIKVLKRVSYGVRNFERFRNRILHVMAA